ncbi:glycosyltransferase family 9 protein [Nocardia donostiensis]|uniref:Glycosyl transferase n=1 Tax=Nocardia donostiensis TaxID=1538463 RepID=A0A1V2TGZ2_9NOCA|nr:glycosyltransferase family 9 protein [Nocardia donostiensis]ONM48775.1 glycosyl transferase [Nocardia donostiensis]OQS13027.1 glycosyl transferase [Nocardia donostiensis]OQS18193.1 glycosyl transferase [Nocardia donostiensis]
MSTVLVLRALGLGDLLTALPALRGLRAAYPHQHLVLAAPGWLRPILDRAALDAHLHPTPSLGALRWPGPPPEVAVNLHGRGPQSIADLLGTAPERLITFGHPGYPDIPGPGWPDDIHETQRWCLLLASAGIPADPAQLALEPPEPPSGRLRPYDTTVVIHPGGSSAARRWPAERFAVLAAHLNQKGYRVLVTGDARERRLARAVAAHAGLDPAATLACDLTLDELAATIAHASLLISNDTGVGHLATAFGTPSVLVFGPNPPSWWGPPPYREQHRALWAGHIGDPHAPTPDPGLLAVTTDEVLAAVEEQLDTTSQPAH